MLASLPLSQSTRRYDLDWLRVIAILLLLFYHSGMIFVADWGWHIKNPETSRIFQEWMYFMNRWRMALLFFISGAGTYFALGKRNGGEYIKERTRRLFIPLVFGMLVIIPPQIYMEHLWRGAEYSSYWEFYPSVFEGIPYPEGSTSWHHLWFIAYLFLYSLIALPVFLLLRSRQGKILLDRLAVWFKPWMLYGYALILALGYIPLVFSYPGPQNLVNDWARFVHYLLYFIMGYIVQSNTRLWDLIEHNRKTSLGLAFSCLLIVNYVRWNGLSPEWGLNIDNLLFLTLNIFHAWFWVLSILGYARRYLNRNSRILSYANEGIYPFYVLHQTVIVILGYYVIQADESILTKFLFINFATFVICVGLYEFFIRPFRVTRFLFGMKSIKKTLASFQKKEKKTKNTNKTVSIQT